MSSRIRCAVYTRKSTEEGLEQDFNSLDAQRESCEAFIRSQRSHGWVLMSAHYDDGGISGGTMDRPALQRLLKDIETHRVDLVVVYKVDRLTRSLTDFAKMVEIFESKNISFVSVTQQFNTSTSMGRLTLNVLLSFAQFEREVTGERIRDKIAASKKKGMWMGGVPPLGYDVQDRQLVVNSEEAGTVRTLFQLYLEHETVKALLDKANRRGIVTKRHHRQDGQCVGGRAFSRGQLYRLLSNPLYVGKVMHKGQLFEGQHTGIIHPETFESANELLKRNASRRHSATNAKAPSLLSGLVYDETGDRLCPTHANKKGKRYRYYISKRLMHGNDDGGGWRVPAREFEDAVLSAATLFLRNKRRLLDELRLPSATTSETATAVAQAEALIPRINDGEVLKDLFHRVHLRPDSLRLEITRSSLLQLLLGSQEAHADDTEQLIEFSVPLRLRRRGMETKLILEEGTASLRNVDNRLIALIARSRRWWEMITSGRASSINEVATLEGIDPSDVGRSLQLAFLSPEIVEAIVTGRQPVDLTTQKLRRLSALPFAWDQQAQLLGFGT